MFDLSHQLTILKPSEYVRFVADWMHRATQSVTGGDAISAFAEPSLTGDLVIDALVAAATEAVAIDTHTPIPAWTSAPERFVGTFWYVGPDGLFAYALSNSRPEFKRHYVLVERDSLVSV